MSPATYPTRCQGCGWPIFTGNVYGLCSECFPEVGRPTSLCTCDDSGVHSLGSVASIHGGYTDPECPIHGREDARR